MMSLKYMVMAYSTTVGHPLRKMVLLKLADNADENGNCFPSYQHIADLCEMSKRSVQRHVAKLVEDGLLSIEARMTQKGNSSNIYHLILDGDRLTIGGDTQSLGSDTQSPPLVTHSHPEPSTSLTVIESKESTKEVDPKINHDALSEFVENRKQLKKPMTKLAVTKLTNVLVNYSHEDQKYLIDQSIASGWTSIYPEQLEKRNDTHRSPKVSGQPQQLSGAAGRVANQHAYLNRKIAEADANELGNQTVPAHETAIPAPMGKRISNR